MTASVIRRRTYAERQQRRADENQLAGHVAAAAGQLVAARGEDDATHARFALQIAISNLRRHWGIQ